MAQLLEDGSLFTQCHDTILVTPSLEKKMLFGLDFNGKRKTLRGWGGGVGVVFCTPLKSKAACKLDRPEYDGI